MDLRTKIMGGILGVVVGDALGLPVQFQAREDRTLRPVTGMEGHGTFNLPAGSWSDDSSLTLCLAKSLVAHNGYHGDDLVTRFLAWYSEGYMTPYGFSFDIGCTTSRTMEKLRTGAKLTEAAGRGPRSNGNGALMRILPAAIFYADQDDETAMKMTREIAGITHAHGVSQLAVSIYTLMARWIMRGDTAAEAYSKACAYNWKAHGWDKDTLSNFKLFLCGMIGGLPEKVVPSSGYVVDTLLASTWCLLTSSTCEEAILKAVNLGDDSDTTAAVAGGLAGLLYGTQGIPLIWVNELAKCDEIIEIANEFSDAALKRGTLLAANM